MISLRPRSITSPCSRKARLPKAATREDTLSASTREIAGAAKTAILAVPATAWPAMAVVRPPASHAQNGNTGNNSGKNIGKNGNATTLLALAYPVPPVPRSPGKISIRATHPPPATLPARIPATPARIPAISPAMISAICLATFSTPRSRSRRAWEEWPQVGVRLILSNANSIL